MSTTPTTPNPAATLDSTVNPNVAPGTPHTDADLISKGNAATAAQRDEGPPPPTIPPTQAQRDAESAANARVEAANREARDAEAAAALAKAKLAPPPTSLDLTKPFSAQSTGVNEFTIHQSGLPLGGPLSPHDSAIIIGWLNSVGNPR